MYNIKGPSKIVAKTTRRGISQKMDSFRDHVKNKSVDREVTETVINAPKPVFQQSKKYNNIPKLDRRDDYEITQDHEAIVKYIHDSWTYDSVTKSESENSSNKYYEDEPTPFLRDFKPFDLEAWWGKRLYASVTNSINNN